ncbi:E3 ubiquitin-protein ligase PUB23 [Apostasia shenzhenica]|uniref:U-box domain-containing protein n=1 Tax=Apostasia shenzhenica TaxID=1088818 RepID=A0A2I0B180_9ASPA|nr:E3 ubiquitin-protein ligase PUB23 [Apostasia shenzhenica]
MEEVEVPSYFLCPISLQIMRDPVTLSTGITYDRCSIERWLFSGRRATCPVTKQPLPDSGEGDLIPNHTLRRLIQSWCSANAASGVERFPTPRAPVGKAQLAALLAESQLQNSRVQALRKLKKIVGESERNKQFVAADTGVIDFLVSIVSGKNEEEDYPSPAVDEAVSILHYLQMSDDRLTSLLEKSDGDLISSLTAVLRRSNWQSRAFAVLLIKSLIEASPTATIFIHLSEEFFQEVIRVLRDRVSYQAMKAAMKALYTVLPWGRNAAKAVSAGAVQVLIELLLDEPEKRVCETMLVLLDEMSRSGRGRAEIAGHAAGMAVVSKKILRVSPAASERAVRILYEISRHSATATEKVIEEMVEVGVVSKLCLLLRTEVCSKRAREMAREILRMHSRVWRTSPCLSPQHLKVLRQSSRGRSC